MTLNITVVSAGVVLQSSDFRLTRLDRSTEVISETAQKQVIVKYPTWVGLISYTGIASMRGHDTADWLARTLSPGMGRRTRQEVLNDIVSGANKWLARVPLNSRRHTFTMVTYRFGRPTVWMMSTIERPGAQALTTPEAELMVSRLRPTRPKAIVTGTLGVVNKPGLRELEHAVSTVTDYESLRRAVAWTNRDAAPRSNGAVGENCIVAHLLPDGSGEATVYGKTKAEFIPSMVMSGVEHSSLGMKALREDGEVPEPCRLVGVTWTGDHRHNAAMVALYRPLSTDEGDYTDGWPQRPDLTRARISSSA